MAESKSKKKTPATSATSKGATRAALEEIDRVFHEKARLAILTTIIGSDDGMNFNELKALCDLTDGNLNRHLKVLVDTSVLSVRKTGHGRNTNSHYKLTSKGRKSFQKYLSALEAILNAAKKPTGATDVAAGESASTNRKRKRGDDGGPLPAVG